MTAPLQIPSVPSAIGELWRRVQILEATIPPASLLTGIMGSVFNDAGIISGTGFTVVRENWDGTHVGENYFTVTFDVAFANPPIVLVSGNNNNPPTGAPPQPYFVTHFHPTTALFVVTTFEADGTPEAGGFDFLALEPGV